MDIAHRRRKERNRKRSQNRREGGGVGAPLDGDLEDAYAPKVHEVPKKWLNHKEDG